MTETHDLATLDYKDHSMAKIKLELVSWCANFYMEILCSCQHNTVPPHDHQIKGHKNIENLQLEFQVICISS